jgi:hypothetical protein
MFCLISDANFGTLILMFTKQMFMIFVGGGYINKESGGG